MPQLIYLTSTQSLKITGITSAGSLTASATVTGVLSDTAGVTITGAGALSFAATSGETGSYDHTLTSTISGLLTAGSSYNLTATITVGATVLTERFTFRAEYYTPGPTGALTTLSRVKEHLGIASGTVTYDVKLTGLLSAASKAVAAYCDREFVYEAGRIEYHNGGESYFNLALAPITNSVRIDFAQAALTITNTSADTYEALAQVSATTMTLTRNGSDTSITLSSHASITALAAYINTLGSGWAATVENTNGGFPATRLEGVRGILNAKDDEATFNIWKAINHRVRPNLVTGTTHVVYSPYGWANVRVTYSGGYLPEAMPEDLQAATASLAAAMYRNSSRDGGLKSETLGDYRYENFSPETGAGLAEFVPDVARMLAPYKRVRAL